MCHNGWKHFQEGEERIPIYMNDGDGRDVVELQEELAIFVVYLAAWSNKSIDHNTIQLCRAKHPKQRP